jgi:aldehyde dehydrogenase (NAD+)
VGYDPATGALLGRVRKHTPADVHSMVQRARRAQREYVERTTFADRARMLHALGQYVVEHQRDISNVCARDSGKTCIFMNEVMQWCRFIWIIYYKLIIIVVDAFFGEILTTLEKIAWTCKYGAEVLATEYRPTGALTMHKVARVEYVPLGVVAAIVSWNYPFHNVYIIAVMGII